MDSGVVGYSPWVAKSQTRLSNFTYIHTYIQEGRVVFWSSLFGYLTM